MRVAITRGNSAERLKEPNYVEETEVKHFKHCVNQWKQMRESVYRPAATLLEKVS